ncbi:unnamed protein product [Tenebrio molitor]|nr:unnamed protein product [Tenebrio molitor]
MGPSFPGPFGKDQGWIFRPTRQQGAQEPVSGKATRWSSGALFYLPVFGRRSFMGAFHRKGDPDQSPIPPTGETENNNCACSVLITG